MMNKNTNTFGDYKFPDWVSVKVAQEIIDFWGCFGRTHKEWLKSGNTYEEDAQFPKLGEEVIFFQYECGKIERFEGKFIHSWNNMGRIITRDFRTHVVSTCDEWFYKKEIA